MKAPIDWDKDFSFTKFCKTTRPRLAQAPLRVEVGDYMCIFLGSKIPYIVRKRPDGCFTVVGPYCYKGIMHGEALPKRLNDNTVDIDFV